MSENKCTICGEKFEDKYFDEKQNKCILHCKKDKDTDWIKKSFHSIKTEWDEYERKKTKWNSNKVNLFWEYFIVYANNIRDEDKHIRIENIIIPIYWRNYYNHKDVLILFEQSKVSFIGCKFLDRFELNKKYEKNGEFLNYISFTDSEFKDELIFIDYELGDGVTIYNCTLKKGFFLNNCRVYKLFEVVNSTIEKKVSINYSNFQEELKFLGNSRKEFDLDLSENGNLQVVKIENNNIHNLIIENTELSNSIIIEEKKINKVSFDGSVFLNKLKLKSNKIINTISFYNTIFEELADFYGTEFNKTIFNRTKFKGMTVFTKCKFLDNLDFKYVKFFDETIFREMSLSKKINLREASFVKNPSFLDIQSIDEKKYDIKVANRETARVIKDSFENRNNIIDANSFYALEMKEREKELTWGKDFFEKLVFSIHGWSSNHSQDWLLSLFWIFNISIIISLLGFKLDESAPFLQVLDRTLFTTFSIGIIGIVLFNIKKYIGNWALLIISFFMYVFHNRALDSYSLDDISNYINPFSIMVKGEPLTFGTLIFKIIIAYLIYQLIISIRQNTRRK